MLSSLAHSSLEVHCSYRLKFFVAKNHLSSSTVSNCSLLGSRFARSCSTRPSQRSKYTGGVVLRMRICIAVQRLSRKCVQNKIRPLSLVPRPFPPPVFDRILCAKTEGEGLGERVTCVTSGRREGQTHGGR